MKSNELESLEEHEHILLLIKMNKDDGQEVELCNNSLAKRTNDSRPQEFSMSQSHSPL